MGCASSTVTVTPSTETCEECFHRKYTLGKRIGVGAFAHVYVAKPLKSSLPSTVAVKIQMLNDLTEDRLRMEIILWRCLSGLGKHCNCVEMYEHFFSDSLCYMVIEKCSRELVSHIKSFDVVTETTLGNVFTQMLRGIAHVHSVGIVHRDIKTENFFVGGKDSQTVKLGDFGLAKFVPTSGKLSGVTGTVPYMCPEMLLHRQSDLKADVWSFGVIAYLLLCGEWPYNGHNASSFIKAIASGPPPTFFDKPWLTPIARSFLASLLSRDPNVRPEAASLLGKGFLKEGHKSQIPLDHMLKEAELAVALETPSLPFITNDTLFNDEKKELEHRISSTTLAQNQTGSSFESSTDLGAILPPDLDFNYQMDGEASLNSGSDCQKHNDIEASTTQSTTYSSFGVNSCNDSDSKKDSELSEMHATIAPSSGAFLITL